MDLHQPQLFNIKTLPSLLNFDEYDKVIVSLSGGKDSEVLTLFAIHSLGIPKDKLEVWHQAVDGMNGHKKEFFDWPSTEGYVRKFAEHVGIPLHWQYRDQGIYGEMFRENARQKDVYYMKDGVDTVYHLPTTKGKFSTRRKFPAKSPDLRVRYCSSSAKIDVARRVLANREDLKPNGKPVKILFLTGERREESPNRAKYNEVEHHPANTQKRIVHHYRAVIDMTEKEIWQWLEKYRILPHPAYAIGFPRLSCRSCIFFSPNHWSTLNEVDPDTVKMLHSVEQELGFTLDNKLSIPEMVRIGKSKITEDNMHYIPKVLSEWNDSVHVEGKWELPAGAFGEGGGSL